MGVYSPQAGGSNVIVFNAILTYPLSKTSPTGSLTLFWTINDGHSHLAAAEMEILERLVEPKEFKSTFFAVKSFINHVGLLSPLQVALASPPLSCARR